MLYGLVLSASEIVWLLNGIYIVSVNSIINKIHKTKVKEY